MNLTEKFDRYKKVFGHHRKMRNFGEISPKKKIIRAGLVCKRWCHLVSDLGSQRRFREFHGRAPPMLGFPHLLSHPMSASSSGLPHLDHSRLKHGDSRHGRVLLHTTGATMTPCVWSSGTLSQVSRSDFPSRRGGIHTTGPLQCSAPPPPPVPATTSTAIAACQTLRRGPCRHRMLQRVLFASTALRLVRGVSSPLLRIPVALFKGRCAAPLWVIHSTSCFACLRMITLIEISSIIIWARGQ